MNSTVKQVLVWVFIIAAFSCLWIFVGKNLRNSHDHAITVADLLKDVDEGKVGEIMVNGGNSSTASTVVGKYKDGSRFTANIPVFDPNLYKSLQDHGVNISFEDHNSMWPIFLTYALPLLLSLGFTLFLIIPSWQIVKKAGFPAPFSLLLLVPLVNLAAIYIFAFSAWKVVPASQPTNQ